MLACNWYLKNSVLRLCSHQFTHGVKRTVLYASSLKLNLNNQEKWSIPYTESSNNFNKAFNFILPFKCVNKKHFSTSVITNKSKKEDDMVCVLNVAEKNDAAKNLADIMSRGGYTRREGFSVYNKIYEFDMVLNGQQCRMRMTSVSGHLLNHEFVGQNRKWYGCHPVELFDAPIVKGCTENMLNIKKTLEREARNAQKLIIWTDCDREGENIGFEIIDVCKAVKPQLIVQRAKFSEITQRSVQRALQTLGQPDELQNKAVDVRAELDLRIGAAFTRFQTLRLQKVFPQTLSDSVISYGSCQFPTLGFVVERYKAIQQFIPESFWKIKVSHDGGDGLIDFLWKRVRLFERLACQVLLEQCQDDPTATVVSVVTKPKSKWRPLPMDTIELEKLGSRKLKINAKETMRIAEKLYTSGIISYPRTETNIFPPELNLVPLVQMQTPDPNWGDFASMIIANGPNPRKGKKSDQAHPPIHPTKHVTNLQGDEKKVYDLIVRHFLACLSKDAQGQETIVEIDIAAERFSANGLIITERNYLEVYPYDRWSDKVMPQYIQGQTFQPTSIEMAEGETSPPSLLTEADLIALMEKHGIGTDATHAEHIETIKSRMYVGLQENKFVPGELGMGLVDGYDAMGFQMSKPNLRSDFEADLKRICDGSKDADAVLRDQIQKYKEVFIEAVNQANKIDEALANLLAERPTAASDNNTESVFPQMCQAVVKCMECNTGSDIVIKKRRNGEGYFLSCQGYPQCKSVRWLPESVISINTLDQSCQQCPGKPKLVKLKFKPRSFAPILPDEYTGCLGGCDTLLTDTLGILPLPRARAAVTANSRSGGNHPGDDDRGSGRVRISQPSNRSQDDSGFNTFSSFNSNTRNNLPSSNESRGSYRPNVHQSVPPSFSNDENAIVCNCNINASLLTVRKEGPNTGRQFYVCGKPREESCKFFLWADESATPNSFNNNSTNNDISQSQNNNWRPQTVPLQNSNHFSQDSNRTRGSNPDDSVLCHCQQTVITLTVKKDSIHKGRKFYKCKDDKCKFFQWADEEPRYSNNFDSGNFNSTFNTGTNFTNSYSSNFNNQSQTTTNHNSNDIQINCDCNQSAVKRTTQKEGPNKGRDFYVCNKPRENQCRFFKWADEIGGDTRVANGFNANSYSNFSTGSSSSSSSNTFAGNSSRGRNSVKGVKRKAPGEVKKRKCGVCGVEGHNRKNCPQNVFDFD